VNFERRNYAYTRLELVGKDELFPNAPIHPAFQIDAYTFGGVRDLLQNQHWQLGLGADVTFYSKPAALDPIYGNNPVSFHVFLRLRPGLSGHGHLEVQRHVVKSGTRWRFSSSQASRLRHNLLGGSFPENVAHPAYCDAGGSRAVRICGRASAASSEAH